MGQREIPRQPRRGKERGHGVKGIGGYASSGYDWKRVKLTGGKPPARRSGHR